MASKRLADDWQGVFSIRLVQVVAMILAVACSLAVCAAEAVAEDAIGVIRISKGAASIVRNGKPFPATTGTKLLSGDTLETAADGSLGFVLRDNSVIAIGPDSSFLISKFLFVPAAKKLALVGRLSRGTLEYVSGVIGKLAPESVHFEMPATTVHTRGTHFFMKAERAAVL